ncbi:MAG TPA: cytochrome-c peroxidase [Candidatus Margulisiibacteriota bacterium]|nr:cytochrome-c peroxidase [Candidatus Margulisiibacteriota bacterium]
MKSLMLALVAAALVHCRQATAADAPPQAAAPPSAPAQTVTSGKWSMTLPLGLQAGSAYIPDGNPMSDDKIALGKLLYFDPRLSKDKTISCASCHNPFHGFTDPARTSKGVGGQLGGRNSPTVINRLFSAEQFWDGRAKDLEEQAHGPLVNPVEMAMGSHNDVVARMRAIKGYAPLFKKAFGDDKIDMPRIAQAIAAYERTVVSGDSPYDRYQAGDKDALSASAVRGMQLFNGKANCKACHTGFNFTDETYQNIGVGMDKPKPDLGRYDVTKKEEDKGKFKTPTLRNIVQTAPYMHDGSETTLLEVVEFYDKGGTPNPNLSKEIKPLNLTAQEKHDLVAFLEALTGDVANAAPRATLPQ